MKKKNTLPLQIVCSVACIILLLVCAKSIHDGAVRALVVTNYILFIFGMCSYNVCLSCVKYVFIY